MAGPLLPPSQDVDEGDRQPPLPHQQQLLLLAHLLTEPQVGSQLISTYRQVAASLPPQDVDEGYLGEISSSKSTAGVTDTGGK